MSVKGKIYAKYLKRAKYVVKGRRLKTPIATIQKRIVPKGTVVNNINVPQSVQNQNNNLQMKKVNSNDFDKGSNKRNKNSDEKEISFVEMGKKIVDGDEDTKSKKGDSKSLMVVCTALAIIIIAAMVKVGSMVYTEITPEKKVASKEAKEVDKNDELSDFLLGNDGEGLQPTEDEMEEILEEVLESEGTDIDSISEQERQTRLKQIEKEINSTENQSNTTAKSREEYLQQIGNKLSGVDSNLNGGSNNTTKPTDSPAKPDSPTEPSRPNHGDDDDDDDDDDDGELPGNPGNGNGAPTAGDEDKVKYVVIGKSNNAFNLYHVTKSSILSSSVSKNVYTDYKEDKGEIKVKESEASGMWFIDEGNGLKPLSSNICTVTLKAKSDEQWVTESVYYASSGSVMVFESNYVEDGEGGEGKQTFTINKSMTLYKK